YIVSLAENEVAVQLGPVVDSGLQPWPGEEEPNEPEARIALGFPLRLTYSSEIRVEAFVGPSLEFERQEAHLVVHFLPWHRRWSHSLVLAGLLGALVAVLWGRWAGVVCAGGYTLHVLQDQLGHLGCNLLWPLTRRRAPGLGLSHSTDPLPNLFVVWTSLALVLSNLSRFSHDAGVPASVLGAVWAVALGLLGRSMLRYLDRPVGKRETGNRAERERRRPWRRAWGADGVPCSGRGAPCFWRRCLAGRSRGPARIAGRQQPTRRQSSTR
ncbi:MAG: metal-dependent hydrolase, partial [Chloroflexia bacterium]